MIAEGEGSGVGFWAAWRSRSSRKRVTRKNSCVESNSSRRGAGEEGFGVEVTVSVVGEVALPFPLSRPGALTTAFSPSSCASAAFEAAASISSFPFGGVVVGVGLRSAVVRREE